MEKLWLVGQAIFFFQRTRWCWMCTVSVFSSQANLPLSDINRQDNKTLRAQFRIIFSNQRLISCQFAFTLPKMWRFYHHAVKESQAGTTEALISYTYCLHEMVCTYTNSAKMVEHFPKGHLGGPPTQKSKMNLSLIPRIRGHSENKKSSANATATVTLGRAFVRMLWIHLSSDSA